MSAICKNDVSIIYFHLESTGFENDAEIIQIAARSDTKKFNVYINPEQLLIHPRASEVKGFEKIDDELYRYGKRVIPTESITDGLRLFERFIIEVSGTKECLLVTHNAVFGVRILLHQVYKCGLVDDFVNIIFGFADTWPMFKQILPERKGPGKFKLETLTKDFLQSYQRQNYHDAACNVKLLRRLVDRLSSEDKLFKFTKTFRESYIKTLESNNYISSNFQSLDELTLVVPESILKRLTLHGISCKSLINVYKNGGDEGIISLFTEKIAGKPRITKDKKILDKVMRFVNSSKNKKSELRQSLIDSFFERSLKT